MNVIDIKARLEDLGVRKTPIFSGIRPTIKVKDEYLTTSIIEFEKEMIDGVVDEVNICFISPKYYANSLWVGKRLEVYEGAKVIAYVTVTEIINEVLSRDAERWMVLDGRKYHSYEACEKWLLNVLETDEVIHVVWIFSGESKHFWGNEQFDRLVSMVKKYESSDKYLELYEEHAF